MALKLPAPIQGDWSDGKHKNIGIYTSEGGVYDANLDCFQDEINSVLSDLYEKGEDGKFHLKSGIAQAKNGVVKGDSAVFLFKNIIPNSDGSNIVAPTFETMEEVTRSEDWKRNDNDLPDLQNGEYTYMTYATLSGVTNRFSAWSKPMRITGANGEKGADGTDIEFIYTLYTPTDENPIPPYVPGKAILGTSESYVGNGGTSEEAAANYNTTGKRYKLTDKDYVGYRNSNQWSFDGNTGDLPCVWTDNPTGVSDDNQYEWVCMRYSINDSNGRATWSAYQEPSLWSKWGENGQDGDGVEYIFTRTNSKPSSSEDISSIIPYVPQTTEEHYQDSEYTGLSIEEYTALHGSFPNEDIWTDDPQGTTKELPYEWVVMRKKKNNTWKEFGKPSLWSIYAFDGGKTVFIYKKSQAILNSRPVSSDSKVIPSGWSVTEAELTESEKKNGYNIFMSYSDYSEKTESYGTWSIPVRITGQDGEKGADGTDIEFIYARTENNIAPTYIPLKGEKYIDGAITKDFSKDDYTGYPTKEIWESKTKAEDKVGKTWIKWYDNPQGVTEILKYEWVAVRYSSLDSNKNKAWNDEFQGPSLWSKWGDKGQDGDGYEYIFKATAANLAAPEAPDDSYQWTPEEGSEYENKNTTDITKDDFIPNGWTDDPQGVNNTNRQIEYVSVRKKENNTWGPYSEPKVWARYAKDGDTGNTYKYAYTVNETKPDRPINKQAPSHPWYSDESMLGEGIVWMSSCLFNPNTNTYGNWSDPIRLTGDKGEKGADGTDIEFIYIGGPIESFINEHPISLTPWKPTTAQSSGVYKDKNTSDPSDDDFIPENWLDNPPSLDGVNIKYIWVATRSKENDTWSNFGSPTLWSRWGENGRDGDGVEYIYKLSTKLLSDSEILSSGYDSTDPSENSATNDIEKDDFVPDGWTDNPSGVTSYYPYEYVSIRKKKTLDKDTTGTWQPFVKPTLWATWTANGTTITFIYKNSSTDPGDIDAATWSGASTIPTGWSKNMTNPGTNQYTYMSQSYTKKNGDTIVYEGWSKPARISGADGKPGTDGADIEYVYLRTKSVPQVNGVISSPATPTGDADTNDDYSPVGNIDSEPEDNWGWFDHPQGVNGKWKYEWVSIRTKRAASENEATHWSEYSIPVIWASFGEKGQDGDGVEYIYKTTPTITPPTKPGTTSEWLWTPNEGSSEEGKNTTNPNEEDFIPKGWTDDPLDVSLENQFQWVCSRKKVTDPNTSLTHFGDFTEPKLWSRWGAAGDSLISIYCYTVVDKSDFTDPASPSSPLLDHEPSTSGESSNGAVWYPAMPSPTVPDNKTAIIWSSQNKKYWSDEVGDFVIDSSDWSAPARISGKNGLPGEDGDSIEFIYFRTDAIDNITWGNSGSEYVHPKNIKTGSKDYLDSTTNLPSDGFVPSGWTDHPQGVENAVNKRYEWVSSRTKKKQENSDTRIWGSFSDPAIWARYSQDGKDGDGVEYVFYIDSDGDEDSSPATPSLNSWNPGSDPEYAGKNTTEPTADDFIPEGWTDEPKLNNSKDGTIEWVSIRKSITNGNGKRTWQGFSKPTVWARASKDGEAGNSTVFIYKLSEDDIDVAPTSSGSVIPTGWSLKMPAYEAGKGIYMSFAEKNNTTGIYGTWSIPTKITGDDGQPGKDGTSIEFIYARVNEEPNKPKESDYTKDGVLHRWTDSYFIPEKSDLDADKVFDWTDHPQGVDKDNTHEWVCTRKRIIDQNTLLSGWTSWTAPALWSKFGEKGQDGDGVQYIYKRNSDETSAPELVENGDNLPSGWNNDPLGVTDLLPFEWVSTRRKTDTTWGHWSDPVIWSRYAVTYQIETIFLNQSVDLAAPTIPSTEVGKTTIPEHWTNNAVSPKTGYVTYMSQSNKNTTTGKYVGWSTPIRITGTDGHNGTDGTAIEFIYKLYKPTTDKPTPPAPGTTPAAGSSAYNSGKNAGFVPEGWTDHPTGIDSKNTHEWMCSRTYDPVDQAWRAFVGPSLWSRWGEDGTDGDGVYYWFLRYSGTAPTVDTVTLGENGVPANFGGVTWTDNPRGVDKDNKKEYVLMVRYANDHYTISSVTLWKEFVKDGSSIVSIYLNNDGGNPNLIEYSPNNRIPAGWSKNLSYETGKVTWMAQATLDPSTNLYSTWQGPFRVTGDKGEPGNDGTNIEFIYLKTSESVSQSTVAEYVDTLNSDSLKSYFNVDDFPTSSAENYSEFHDLLSSQISSIGEWHDSPQGVDSKQSLEWISQRIKEEGEDDWGIFSPPVLWSKYGHDGKDGDGIEYRFKLVSSAEADNVVNAPSTVNEYNSKWTADPSKTGVSEEYPIEYCCIRKTKVNANGIAVDSFSVSVWNEFSPYTRYAEVGYTKSKSGDLSGLAFGTTKGGPNSNYYLTTSSSSSIGVLTNDSITDGALLYVILTVKNLSENCVVNLDICNKKNNTKIYDAIKTRFIGEDIADGSVITKDGSYKILVEYVGFKNSDFSSDIYIEPIVLSKTASTTNKAASIEVSSYRLSNISQSSTADSKFIGVLTGSLVRISNESSTYSGVDWTAFEWSKISGIDGTSSVQIVSDSEIIGVTAESIISDNEANSEVIGYTVPITEENPAIFNCKLMEGNNNVTSSANWRLVANSQFEDNVNSIGGYKADNYTVRVTGCALGTTNNTNLKPEITVTASYKGEDYTKVLYIGITKVDYTSIFSVTNKQFKSQFDEFTKSFDGKIQDATTSIEQTAEGLDLLAQKSSTGVGTNLIKNSVFNIDESENSKKITDWDGKTDSVKSITGDSARYELDSTDYLSQNLNQTEVSLKSGSWYTISFDVESDADNSYVTVGGFKYAVAPNSDSNYSFDSKISSKYLYPSEKDGGAGGESVTWKTDKDLKLRLTYTFYNNNSSTFRFKKSGSGNVYISKIKLEEGKISTPWMSDVLTMADVKSQINIEAGQIESRVSKSVAESIGSGSNILSNTKFESNHDKWGINTGLNNGNYIVFGTETDGIPFARFEQYGSANSAYLFQNGIDNKISGEFEKNSWYTLSWKQKRTNGNNGYVIASVSGVVADYYTSNDQTTISGPAYGTVSERFEEGKDFPNDVYEKKFITFFTKDSFNAIDDNYNNRRLVQFTYGNDTATNISPVTIAGIKLEKGRYATDWSDDGVSSYTLESRITQTEQSISLKVIDGTPSANKNLLKNTTWDDISNGEVYITNPNWNLINNRYKSFEFISIKRSTDVDDSYNGKPTLVIQSDLNQDEPSGQAFYELQQGVALNGKSIYTLSFFYRTSKNTFSTGIYLDGVSNVNAYVITDFVNVTKSSVFHSGDNAALWNIWPDTNGNWYKAVVTFQTGTNVSSGIFFIRQTSNNDAADSSDRLPKINLACLKLEAGNEPTSWYAGVSADDLLATGIDIDNKSVVVTADNFKVRTKDGTTNFIEASADGTLSLNSSMIKLSGDITANGNVTIDSNGCITAKNANIQGTVDTTDESGHGIKIDPDSQKITVYDDTGNEVTSISGEKKSGAAEIYGNSTSTPEITFDPSTIIGGNNWVVDNNSEDLRAMYDFTLLSYSFDLDSATEVSIQYPSINLSNTLDSSTFRSTFDNPDGEYWNFYCYFHIYLSGVGYIYQKTVYKPEFISNGYNYPLCQKEKKSFKLSEGAHELFITVTLEFRSNYKRYVPAENYLNYHVDNFHVQPAGDSNKVIITAIPNTFTSRLFSNGLSLGTNYQDNLTIINGSGGTGTSLLFINGNTGFKLTNEGVYVSYNAGSRANQFTPIYSRVPEILCVGYVEYFGTDYYQIKHMFGSRLNTNTTFTNEITRLKEGKVSINFSKFLNVSEEEWNRVFITITPGLTWSGSPCHVSIQTKTITNSTFVIGDDGSPNDGHFYFKLELL